MGGGRKIVTVPGSDVVVDLGVVSGVSKVYYETRAHMNDDHWYYYVHLQGSDKMKVDCDRLGKSRVEFTDMLLEHDKTQETESE